MGPTRKLSHDEVKEVLRVEDEQLARLHTQLEVHSARTSSAHVRLLKTIDVLDSLRAQHALDLATAHQDRVALARDCNRWRIRAQALEAEKDDLQDVVQDLIEKVQISNEWSSWPCGRMFITKHAESILTSAEPFVHVRKCNEDLVYASSIIARLRAELDLERQQHHQMVEEANARVEELEARVAVREAELEMWITTPSPSREADASTENVRDTTPRLQPARMAPFHPRPISDEECLRVLESNSARNKSLEMEIRDIVTRLEQARFAAPSLDDCPRAESPQTETGNGHTPTQLEPVPPTSFSKAQVPTDPSLTVIAQLDEHIRTMAAQIDSLRAERTALVEAAVRQKQHTSSTKVDDTQTIMRVEAECIRFSAQVRSLEQQLERTQVSARIREDELLAEIAALRGRVEQPCHITPLGADIARECLGLPTPLQPSSLPLPVQSRPPRSPCLMDPYFIPSPERTSSPRASPCAS